MAQVTAGERGGGILMEGIKMHDEINTATLERLTSVRTRVQYIGHGSQN